MDDDNDGEPEREYEREVEEEDTFDVVLATPIGVVVAVVRVVSSGGITADRLLGGGRTVATRSLSFRGGLDDPSRAALDRAGTCGLSGEPDRPPKTCMTPLLAGNSAGSGE